MLKTAIIYHSFLGTSKKYATWLAEAVLADIFSFRQIKQIPFEDYQIVVIVSGTYVGKMPLVNFLHRHWHSLTDKKVVVIAVGLLPPGLLQSKQSYQSIPATIREKVKYFKLPGKLITATAAGEPSADKLDAIISYIHSLQSP